MSIYVCAFLIGVIAGLRALTAPAAVSWAARLGWIHLENTGLAFMGAAITPWILSVLAIGELINESCRNAQQEGVCPFRGAHVTALSGAVLGASHGSLAGGLVAGALGAVAGTLGGYEVRTRLVRATGGKDLPIALLEDAIAVLGAVWIAGGFA